MKKHLIALLILISPWCVVMAQVAPASQEGVKTSPNSNVVTPGEPLYVISSDDKQLEFVAEKEEETKLFFSTLLPEWIESVSVMKGEDAVNKYGTRGKFGVVLIALEEGSLQKLPEEMQKRFSKSKS